MDDLTIGFSPCPNDTYIFHALACGLLDLPFRPRVVLEDVEKLNQKVREGCLDVSKISAHAALHIMDNYRLLRSGGAIGRGCGPLLAARTTMAIEELRDAVIAVPGKLTTAHLLLRLHGVHRGPCIPMQFDRIMPAIASGEVDAGVIIHEGRFTYHSYGLRLLLDLGQWWEQETGLPLPLGAIAVRRDLGSQIARVMEEKIRESIVHARMNPAAAWTYISRHAQEMEPDVIRRHIDTFVNDFSIDSGKEGELALITLLKAACRLENVPFPSGGIFWS